MAMYQYLAGNKEGKTVSGQIEGDNQSQVAESIRKQGLFVLEIKKSSQLGPLDISKLTEFIDSHVGSELGASERVMFTQHLASMIKTGVPLVDSITTFIDQKGKSRTRTMLNQIITELEAGQPLSQAFAKYPKAFPPIYTNIVASGESMGTLGNTLEYLAEQLDKDLALVSHVRGALIYPAVILFTMILVVLFITFAVVPKLIAFAASAGQELPIYTRILIGSTNVILHHGIWVGMGFVAFILLFIRLIHTKQGEEKLDTLLLTIPLIGNLVHKFNMARFARLLGSFYHYGIPLPKAFDILSHALPSIHYQYAVIDVKNQMSKGMSLAESLDMQPTNLFPRIMIKVLNSAEKTASVDEALTRLAQYYERELDDTLKNLIIIIEPVLILVLGVAVVGIALAVIVPIYKITSSVQ